ncbi:hypothetical protein ETB97_000528, partial [Aspergillus alliaceus]
MVLLPRPAAASENTGRRLGPPGRYQLPCDDEAEISPPGTASRSSGGARISPVSSEHSDHHIPPTDRATGGQPRKDYSQILEIPDSEDEAMDESIELAGPGDTGTPCLPSTRAKAQPIHNSSQGIP